MEHHVVGREGLVRYVKRVTLQGREIRGFLLLIPHVSCQELADIPKIIFQHVVLLGC